MVSSFDLTFDGLDSAGKSTQSAERLPSIFTLKTDEMEKFECIPSVVTFKSLIHCLCKAKELQKAHLLFYNMEIGRNPSLFLRLSKGVEWVLDTDLDGLQRSFTLIAHSHLLFIEKEKLQSHDASRSTSGLSLEFPKRMPSRVSHELKLPP
ncbi:Pentatricopeptide repeat [Dillenia turbinata]|uniref:Pentatricopeptide repeat n=1 Tax=Dillenia turbinata TaxID=194707 RepID=A0AAN8W664_9MAGN